jgi:hypothetical protein
MKLTDDEYNAIRNRDVSKVRVGSHKREEKGKKVAPEKPKDNKYNPTEAEVTKQIRAYLNLRHIFHYKAWQGMMSKHGISDIICCHNGRFIAIEVKRKGGKVSEHQQAFINQVRAAGGVAFIAYSIDDLIQYFPGL